MSQTHASDDRGAFSFWCPCASLAGSRSAAEAPRRQFEEPILLTSAGQSVDIKLAGVLLDRLKIEYTAIPRPPRSDLAGYKTLLVVPGYSSKGLGAAGVSREDEMKRVKDLLAAAAEAKIQVLTLHLGGKATARRAVGRLQRRGRRGRRIWPSWSPRATRTGSSRDLCKEDARAAEGRQDHGGCHEAPGRGVRHSEERRRSHLRSAGMRSAATAGGSSIGGSSLIAVAVLVAVTGRARSWRHGSGGVAATAHPLATEAALADAVPGRQRRRRGGGGRLRHRRRGARRFRTGRRRRHARLPARPAARPSTSTTTTRRRRIPAPISFDAGRGSQHREVRAGARARWPGCARPWRTTAPCRCRW